MNVPRLILHVGHPKTGTSALQSSFALSVEALAAQGIHYSPAGSLDLARDGKITSGNVNPLRLVETYNRAVRTAAGAEAVLLSNEACFIAFEKDPAPLRRLTEQGVPVEIVLFLRDPLDWAGSSYMQSIKRHGGKRSFSEFLPNARFLERGRAFPRDLRCAEPAGLHGELLAVRGRAGAADGGAPLPAARHAGRTCRGAHQPLHDLVRGLSAAPDQRRSGPPRSARGLHRPV